MNKLNLPGKVPLKETKLVTGSLYGRRKARRGLFPYGFRMSLATFYGGMWFYSQVPDIKPATLAAGSLEWRLGYKLARFLERGWRIAV